MRPTIAGLALVGAVAMAPLALAQTAPGSATPPATTPPPAASTAPGATAAPAADPRPSGALRSEGSRADATPRMPEPGANSFTEGQARSRIESAGYADVVGLRLDDQGIWRGRAMRNGQPVDVALDFRGNVIAGPGATASGMGTTGTGATGAPAPAAIAPGTSGGGTTAAPTAAPPSPPAAGAGSTTAPSR